MTKEVHVTILDTPSSRSVSVPRCFWWSKCKHIAMFFFILHEIHEIWNLFLLFRIFHDSGLQRGDNMIVWSRRSQKWNIHYHTCQENIQNKKITCPQDTLRQVSGCFCRSPRVTGGDFEQNQVKTTKIIKKSTKFNEIHQNL